jgi:hypothetical protein
VGGVSHSGCKDGAVKRHWVVIGVVAWIVVIAGAGLWSYFKDPATTRDQTTIADALPTVDDALGRIYAAIDPSSSVAVLGGYRRTESSCRVTSARDGTRFSRELTVYVKPETESATLDHVQAALPAAYHPKVAHSGSSDVLSADAGEFVLVRGVVTDPGVLRFSADTGCRVQDAAVQDAPPESADRSPVQAVLDTLGGTAADWRAHRLTGSSCGSLSTAEATTSGDLGRVTVDGPQVVLRSERVIAYRAGAAGIVVRRDGNVVVVSSTTGC